MKLYINVQQKSDVGSSRIINRSCITLPILSCSLIFGKFYPDKL